MIRFNYFNTIKNITKLSMLLPLIIFQKSYAINLDEAIALSLKTHPAIKSKQAEFEAADGDLASAKWQRWPSVSATSQSANKRTQGYKDKNGETVTIEQPLYAGGKISANIDMADSKKEAANNAVFESRQQLALKIADSYASALKFFQKAEFSKINVTQHYKLYGSIKNRAESGISSLADVSLAKARLNQAKSELSQLNISYSNAVAALAILVGSHIDNIDNLSSIALPNENIKNIIATAKQNSPTLKKLTKEIDVSNYDKDIKKSVLYPQVNLKAERYFGLTQEQNIDQSRVYVSVSMQPGSGLSSYSNIQSAQKRVLVAHENLEASKLDIEEQVTNQYNEAKNYYFQLADADSYAEEAQNVADSYERQYIIGKKSWLDLLNAKKEAIQAKYNLVDVRVSEVVAIKKLLIITEKIEGDLQ